MDELNLQLQSYRLAADDRRWVELVDKHRSARGNLALGGLSRLVAAPLHVDG